VSRNLEIVGATPPKPPAHLSKASSAWWREVVRDWKMETHHLQLLTLAAEALDRAEEARAAVAGAGAYYADRWGAPRPHPGIAVERDARLQYARLLKQLDLDADPVPAAMSLAGRRRRG